MKPFPFSWNLLVACLALATARNGNAQSSPNLREKVKSASYSDRLGGSVALLGRPGSAFATLDSSTNVSSADSNTVPFLTTLSPLPGSTLSGLVEGADGNYYGTTENGGTLNQGTVFQLTADGILTTLYSFTGSNDGANPPVGLTLAADGSLYGTTTRQGLAGAGTVFRITTDGTLSTVYSFTGGKDGYTPSSALVLGPDGNFYGTTGYGGAGGYGSIFRISPSGAETVIYSFVSTNAGSMPASELVVANGNFYGTSQSGGANGLGTIFKITPSGTFTLLDSFSSTTGGNGTGLPGPQLALGTNGNFYGTTYSGGASNNGTLFQVAQDGTFTTIYSFTGGLDGGNPVGGLVQGRDGYFYGTTTEGGASIAQDPRLHSYGTLFQATSTGAIRTMHSFSATDGGSPFATLVQAKDGGFYGTTTTTAFRLILITPPSIVNQPTNQTVGPGDSIVLSVVTGGSAPLTYQWLFDGTNLDGATSSALVLTNVQLAQAGYYSVTVSNVAGSVTSSNAVLIVNAGSSSALSLTTLATLPGRRLSGLVQAGDGNYYGTTEYGGTLNQGTVFQLTAGGVLTTLYSFTGGNDGANPLAGLALGPDSSLYGTTSSGADMSQDFSGAGTVFRITTNGTFSTVYSFTGGNDGDTPSAGLVLGPDGNFYGTTEFGGADGYGCIFKISPGGAETAIYSFVYTMVGTTFTFPDGSSPASAMVLGGGNFYGTSQAGGANGSGTVFNLTPGGTLTTLDSFSLATGGNGSGLPGPQLAIGTNGILYGTTYSGGVSNKGTIFQVAKDGTFKTIYSFTGGADGARPVGGLVQGSDGYFYGTTSAGGASVAQDPAGLGFGALFQASSAGAVTNLYSFTGAADGASPYATLVQGSDGGYYGTTTTTAFRLNVITLPSVLLNPINQTVAPGGSATFNVVADGAAPLGYQWQFDGTNLDGAISSVLVLTNVQLAQAGYYTVLVANAGGAVTSSVALLTVTAPAAITSQPTNQTVNFGRTATFSVTTIGTPPLNYQWRLNGANLSGANEPSLVLTNAQLTDAGNYTVVISGAGGVVTSSNAVLTVIHVPPIITTQPAAEMARLGLATTFSVVAAGTPPLSYQWQFGGTNLPGATSTNLTLTNLDVGQAGLYSVTVSNSYGTATSSAALLTVIVPPAITAQPEDQTVSVGQTANFSVTAAGTPPLTYQWRLNSVNVGGAIESTLVLTNVQLSKAGDYTVVIGGPGGTVTSSNAVLTLNNAPPIITKQPAAQTAGVGQAAIFGVVAAGTVPLSYQWQLDGTNLPGATATNLTLSNLDTGEAGLYSVTVSNAFGTVTSSNALLKVVLSPIFLTQPQGKTVNGMTNITLSASATGATPLTYQWLANGIAVAGATNTSLTLTNATPGQSGNYVLVVNNAYGSATSSPALVLVEGFYTVTTMAGSPGLSEATDGGEGSARFFGPYGVALDNTGNVYVADTGNSTLRKITPNGLVTTLAGRANYAGSSNGTATNARFNRPEALAVDGAGNIYVSDSGNQTMRKITPAGVGSTIVGLANAVGFTDGASNVARFDFPVGIGMDSPNNLYVADTQNSTIRKITPRGLVSTLAGAARFTGYVDSFTNIARFDSPMGIAVDALNNIYIADKFNNSIRKITSAGLVTTLAGSTTRLSGTTDGVATNARFFGPTALTLDQAGNIYVADTGNHAIRMITAAGVVVTLAGAPRIPGATDGTGTLAQFNTPYGIAVDSAGDLYVADTLNSTIRKAYPLGTTAAPKFPSPLQSQTAIAGTTVVFASNVTGTAPLSLQWQIAGVNIAGAVGPNLILTNVSQATAGQYRLIATNYFGRIISANAFLTVLPAPTGAIINPSRVQDTFSFGFSTSAGASYTLEYTDSLSSPVWTQIETVPGNGAEITLTDPAASTAARFYRVVIH